MRNGAEKRMYDGRIEVGVKGFWKGNKADNISIDCHLPRERTCAAERLTG